MRVNVPLDRESEDVKTWMYEFTNSRRFKSICVHELGGGYEVILVIKEEHQDDFKDRFPLQHRDKFTKSYPDQKELVNDIIDLFNMEVVLRDREGVK